MDKLEEEIKILKDTLGKKDENISDLEKDMSDINDKNKVLKKKKKRRIKKKRIKK